MMRILHAAVAALAVYSSNCLAVASVSLNLIDRSVSPAVFTSEDGSGLIEIGRFISSGSAFATGSANLNTGAMRVAMLAPPATTSQASAEVRFSDTISFSGASSEVAYLDWFVEGTISESDGVHSAAGLTFFDGGARIYQAMFFNQDGRCPPASATSQCAVGNAFRQSGTIALSIDQSHDLEVRLGGGAQSGQSVNFGNSAYIHLRTPVGVTYTSGSGMFLTAASPVPELSSFAMTSIGVVGLLLSGSQRRRRRY